MTLAAIATLTRQSKHKPGTPESSVPGHKGKNSLLKIMLISFYFLCSHSLKQKVDSLFTTSEFPMSTDVSYNSVAKDTAPLLHVWHWLLSSAWLCWHHSISLQPPASGAHGPAHLACWYLIGTNRAKTTKPWKITRSFPSAYSRQGCEYTNHLFTV